MDKVAVLCTILAIIAAAESANCYNGCTLITKYEMTVSGETNDMLKEMPDSVKKCPGTAAACASGTECMAFKPTLEADLTIASVSGKMKIESSSHMCLASGTKMTDEVCNLYTDAIKSMISGGVFSNIKSDCGKLEAASGASGFSFGALLVAVVYLVY